MDIIGILKHPWPWWIVGPLIGLFVPILLILDNRQFGVSANLRHCCAIIPNKVSFFNYDWRKAGTWNLFFAAGIILGGFIAHYFLGNPEPMKVADATVRDLSNLGVVPDGGLIPTTLFSWSSLFTLRGLIMIVGGGFMVGFGARYAGGCTSGHAISGISDLQIPSMVATAFFFVGGLITTFVIFPFLLRL